MRRNVVDSAPRPESVATLIEQIAKRVSRYAETLTQLDGWARRGTLFLLGATTTLAVAPVFAWPVMLMTLPALALMVGGTLPASSRFSWKTTIRAAVDGWWFGAGYFMAGLHWIVEPFLVDAETFAWLIPFAITLMPAGLALFFAAATASARALWLPGWRSSIPLAAAFGASEWLRGAVFTGFPWNPLGDGLTGNSWTLQWAALVGIDGLNILTVLLFTAPALLLLDLVSGQTTRRNTLSIVACGGLVVGVGLFYGAERSSHVTEQYPDIRLRLVQPAIPQEEKWKPGNQRWVFDQLLSASRQNTEGRVDDLAGVSHVIWPEAAMPFLPLRTPQAMADIAALLPANAVLITGALRVEMVGDATEQKRKTYNTLLAFSDDGKPISQYDKQHLVPFGEYLPFQSVLEAVGLQQLTRLRGGFTPGTSTRAMTVPGLPIFTPLICYEVIFSGAIVPTGQRSDWLLVVTNDAWFGRWAGPRQHFHQARVRAVEEGLALVRVSNNGISGMISPYGNVDTLLELNRRGSIDVSLPTPAPQTVFSRYGHAPFTIFLVLSVIITLSLRRAKV